MRILSFNTGYLLGYQNVLWGYVPPPVQSLVGDGEVEQRNFERLVELIDREQPDIVGLVELDQGSHRTTTAGQFRTLVDRLQDNGLPYSGQAANKYGQHRVISSLPFYRHLGNAVLSRDDIQVTTHTHYLTTGRKRLVIEVDLSSDVVLFLVHLSLRASTREQQLGELAELVGRRAGERQVIVTGDFNIFDGFEELDEFRERTGLEMQVPGATIPERPFDDLLLSSRTIDLFLSSPTISVEQCRVLDEQLSDHRPVVLETA